MGLHVLRHAVVQAAHLERAEDLMAKLTKVAAAIKLRTGDPLTEGGHNPVAELQHYFGGVANTVTTSWKASDRLHVLTCVANLGNLDKTLKCMKPAGHQSGTDCFQGVTRSVCSHLLSIAA